MDEAVEMIALRFALIHERDERGDGADDESGLVFEEGVERRRRLKAVGQDKSGARREGRHHLDREARDMEKRRHPENARGAVELEMIAANQSIRNEIAVRQHGALWNARCARRIEQQGDVVR